MSDIDEVTVSAFVVKASGWMMLGLFVAASIAVVTTTAGESLPVKSQPGFIDAIFANRVTLAAGRIAVITGSAYLVASVGALLMRREFVIEFGPFKTASVDTQVSEMATALTSKEAEIASLEARVSSQAERIAELSIENDDSRQEMLAMARRIVNMEKDS